MWKTDEAGVRFVDLPKSPAPAAAEGLRYSQLKQLAKEFAGRGQFGKDPRDVELRLLPEPLDRYAAPKKNVVAGGLFAFVRATDTEIILVIEAQEKDPGSARWRFAAARMHNTAELRLRRQGQDVSEAERLSWQEVFEDHARPYATFRFLETPDFLKAAPAAKPAP